MARVLLLCAAIAGVVVAVVAVILAFSASPLIGLAASGAIVLAFVLWEFTQRRRAAASHRARRAAAPAHGRRAAGRPVRHLFAVESVREQPAPATAPVAIG